MGFASIIKLLCFYALIVLLVPCESLAAQQACQSLTSSATSDDLDDKMKCLSNDLPIEQTIMPGSIAAILCDFRGLFYGAVGKVIIAFNIVMMGFMILNHKMTAPYAILMIGIMAIFINPEGLTDQMVWGMLSGNLADNFKWLCLHNVLNRI